MWDQRIFRFKIEGNSEVDRLIRNPRRTDCGSYIRLLNDNIVYLQVLGDIRCEIELDTVVDGFNIAVIDVYEASCPW